MVVLPADGGAPLPGIHTSSTLYDDRPFLFQRRLPQQPGRTPQRPASQISTKLACTFTLQPGGTYLVCDVRKCIDSVQISANLPQAGL